MMINKHEVTLKLEAADDFRYTEALKTLRTNLMFSGSKVKNILITSTSPNEGKSTTSFELAKAFAESGKRTLYMDCDIRKSEFVSVHQIKEQTSGLSQMLTGQIELEDGFYTDPRIPNLDMIFAGPYSPNPTELFEDEMCDKLFQLIKDLNYDIVIMDTAPVGTVIDAAILTKYADGAALVVESEVTSRHMFQRAKEQLDRTGVRFLGVILNKVNMTKGGYYNRYYSKYGKKYGKYSKYAKYGYGYGGREEAKQK
ncbi:capsular exopolysaccharide family [Oribacterium sp. KHPX15]|uniref:CpsD/CapB family tyrosine-protein kinase n=1 Tax=Oribacterium sp. KHPX15 TaxID=1855342 RepID=UPI00089663ED|nr:CpsD/CapB family tyrosine-protein kinase [Oribacterium sp. KHPX15]SEA81356.1 capsular exopolysaccharide family [Oribacterium sp. KHPX15]